MNVYLVEVGSYSYADIVAVKSSKEEAEALCELFADSRVRGPYEVDSFDTDTPPAGKVFWVVEMGRRGEIKTEYEQGPLVTKYDGDPDDPRTYKGILREESITFRTKKDNKYERSSYWRLRLEKFVDSKEHAIKILGDLRRQILAGQRPACVDMGEN